MSVQLEVKIGRRTFHRNLKPGRVVNLSYDYTRLPVPHFGGLIRVPTEYVEVQNRGTVVWTSPEKTVSLDREEINKADIRKKTILGELLQARVLYRNGEKSD